MRAKLVVGGLVGLFALALPVLGQLPPAPSGSTVTEGVVVAPEVAVRGGGSEKYYVTSKLTKGQKVIILRDSPEFPGWLAIKPPQDSYSWINGKFLTETKIQNQGAVICDPKDEIPILAGSRFSSDPPTATVAKVKRGTLVTIVGQPQLTDNGPWIPIAPTVSEVRYVPAAAIEKKATSVQVGYNDLPKPNPALSQAELERQMLQKAYERETDPALKQLALNKLQSLPPAAISNPATGQRPPAALTPGPSGQPNPGSLTSANGAKWSEWGVLRPTAIVKDGLKWYALHNERGELVLYTTTQPGMASLDNYVGRTVCLFGPMTYVSDPVRTNVLVASHVAVP